MRITGGVFGGRKIRVRGSGLRPTQDRVREALFNRLAPVVGGSFFVDLFAGSGAVGLEAVSRGAARTIWVEQDRKTWQILRENVAAIAGDALTGDVVCDDVFRWLRRTAGGDAKADIIFADPPYRQDLTPGRVLAATGAAGCLKAGGMLVLEQDAGADEEQVEGWALRDARVYGQTRICFFQIQEQVRPTKNFCRVPG